MLIENGGDRFRRDMRRGKWHIEAQASRKSPGKTINADYGYMAAA